MNRSILRIVVHSALFLPTQGGAELYVDNITRNLSAYCDITIVTRPTRATWKVETKHRIVRAWSWAIPLYFTWLVLRKRPDVLHVGLIGYESMILFAIAKIARIPCILTFHGTYSLTSMESSKKVPVPVLALEDLALRSSWSKVVCVDYYSELFVRRRFMVPKERLSVIPSGVDVKEFQIDHERPSASSRDQFTVLCPRRIDPKNGIEFLIRAVIMCKPTIRELQLLIAGRTNDGQQSYEKSLREIIQTSNAESYIRFLGDVEHKRMPSLYNSVDLVVIPSLAEARSLSALEAMACERPVIASRVGGLPEIIRDGLSGILVDPADANGLASAIQRIYKDPELSQELARNARRIALDNDWKIRSREYEQLYMSLFRKS